MSDREPSAIDVAMLKVACSRCGASAGQWCVRTSNRSLKAMNLHVARWTAEVDALVESYRGTAAMEGKTK